MARVSVGWGDGGYAGRGVNAGPRLGIPSGVPSMQRCLEWFSVMQWPNPTSDRRKLLSSMLVISPTINHG